MKCCLIPLQRASLEEARRQRVLARRRRKGDLAIAADDMKVMKNFPHLKNWPIRILNNPTSRYFSQRTEIMISDRQLYLLFQGSSVHANHIRRQSVCPWVGEWWKKISLCQIKSYSGCHLDNVEGTPLSERHSRCSRQIL